MQEEYDPEIEYKNVIVKKKVEVQEIKPLDDFRDLQVNPTLAELYNSYPILRKIKIDGGFDNLDHYLDVNFRLLKEDFTRDLRDGLKIV